MRHERVKVTRDNNTVHNMTVAPWEIPLLEYLFEDGNVTRLDEFVEVDREYPNPHAEFQRLSKAYGQDMKTEVAHAVGLFGAGRQGVKALADLIQAAREADEEAMPEVAPAARYVPKNRRFATDPLLN